MLLLVGGEITQELLHELPACMQLNAVWDELGATADVQDALALRHVSIVRTAYFYLSIIVFASFHRPISTEVVI